MFVMVFMKRLVNVSDLKALSLFCKRSYRVTDLPLDNSFLERIITDLPLDESTIVSWQAILSYMACPQKAALTNLNNKYRFKQLVAAAPLVLPSCRRYEKAWQKAILNIIRNSQQLLILL